MSYKMLIIEDEVMIRKGIIHIMDWKSQGITEIFEASNGREGIEQIQKNRPDIVITDINMPILSGLDVIRDTMEEYKYIPLIVSGYSDFEYAQRAIEYGVSAFLLKPIDVADLTEAIGRAKIQLKKQKLLEDYETSCNDFINQSVSLVDEEEQYSPIVQQTLEYISNHFSEKITLKIIANELHYSENFILRKFKEEVRANFSEYLSRFRINKSMTMMRETDKKIAEIALECGFSEYKYYKLVFTRYVGCTPKDFVVLVKNGKVFL